MPSRAKPTAIVLSLTCRNSGARIVSSAFASGITRCSGKPCDRDVYISGPDHMVVKTARVLRERGAPDRLIHYDLDLKASQGL
jgi:NAD(P)H-flavin reductase